MIHVYYYHSHMFVFHFLLLEFQMGSEGGDGRQITMDEFNMLRVIGRGSYAKVLLVEQKRTKRVYAMKVIKKELVNDDEVT